MSNSSKRSRKHRTKKNKNTKSSRSKKFEEEFDGDKRGFWDEDEEPVDLFSDVTSNNITGESDLSDSFIDNEIYGVTNYDMAYKALLEMGMVTIIDNDENLPDETGWTPKFEVVICPEGHRIHMLDEKSAHWFNKYLKDYYGKNKA